MTGAASCDLRRRRLLVAAASLVAIAGTAAAGGSIAVPDALLIHRDGRPVRLRSDIWRDRVALVNFVFTSCSSFCGIQSAMLAELQTRLGARVGRDVVLISLTVDPLNDDARRLAEFSRPFAPGAGWWWLTGQPATVFRLLEALGASAPDPQDHAPLWIAGRAAAPRRIVGLPSIAQLETALEPDQPLTR